MATAAEVLAYVKANEEVSLGYDMAGTPSVSLSHTSTDTVATTLGAATTPPITKVWGDERQLTAGADTLDLTALGTPLDADVTFSGLKVNVVWIEAASANTAGVKFDVGGSNGYNIFGAASSEVTVLAGDKYLCVFRDTLPDVGGTAKTIDVTSSDTDAIYKIILCAG